MSSSAQLNRATFGPGFGGRIPGPLLLLEARQDQLWVAGAHRNAEAPDAKGF